MFCRKREGGGYENTITSATYKVISIKYQDQESVKVGDELDISKIKITLKTDSKSEQNNSNQKTFSPQETYDYLKSKSKPFSLTIKVGNEKIISFGENDEQFPEYNPFTFMNAGVIEISISGTIGENEVNESSSLDVKGQETTLPSVNVDGIAYTGGVEADDTLDLSNVKITLKVKHFDEEGTLQESTDEYSPSDAYEYLKKQGVSFSLSITVGDKKIISFSDSDECFPEYNQFTFKNAGAIEISISGSINENEASTSYSLNVETKKRPDNHKELLKMILGESKYNEIKAKLESASPDFTLSAEIIKAVGDRYDNILTTDEYDDEVKKSAVAFVAQAEGLVNITKKENKIPDMLFGDEMESVEGWREYAERKSNNTVYEIDEYKVPIKFINEFDLKEFQFPKNNGKGDFDDATLIYTEPITIDSNLLCVAFEKLQDARIGFFPTIRIKRNYLTALQGTSGSTAIFYLYKTYGEQDKLDKIIIIQEE